MIFSKSKFIPILLLITTFGTAQAGDDGARAYWKTMEDTHFLSYQKLTFNVDSSDSQFDPSFGIYPNSETDMDLFVLMYGRQMNLLGRSAMFSASIYGGDISSEIGIDPFDSTSVRARQTASGFGDPSLGLTINLNGAPNIANFYDIANYEPELTVDVSALVTIPVGEYEEDSAVNLGQNRWWGRIAVPVVYYLGSYAPLYRTSIEVTPSVLVFAKNDDFLGQEMENDPMYQLEGHVTHDITRTLFGSIDFMWRKGFDTELDGNDVGDELELKTLGFTVDYTINDNSTIRFSYHSNFIDDDELDADMMRLQFNYGWNPLVENVKQLEHH
jgi:hypothetical protein